MIIVLLREQGERNWDITKNSNKNNTLIPTGRTKTKNKTCYNTLLLFTEHPHLLLQTVGRSSNNDLSNLKIMKIHRLKIYSSKILGLTYPQRRPKIGWHLMLACRIFSEVLSLIEGSRRTSQMASCMVKILLHICWRKVQYCHKFEILNPPKDRVLLRRPFVNICCQPKNRK